MTKQKSIDVRVRDIRAICLGLVVIVPIGEEGAELAWDTAKQWNPDLFGEFSREDLNIIVSTFSATSMDEIIRQMNAKSENDYPNCDMILQYRQIPIQDKDNKPQAVLETVLATFRKSEGDSPAVITGDDLTIVPSSVDVDSDLSDDVYIERWSKEMNTVQKWTDLKLGVGAIVILISIFLFGIASANDWTQLTIITIAAIIASALMIHQGINNRKKSTARLTAEIQQTCQEQGLDTKWVVEILYRKTSGDTRNEILREVGRGTFLGLLDREFPKPRPSPTVPKVDFDKPFFSSTVPGSDFLPGLYKPAKGIESLGVVEIENMIAKMTKAGNVKALFSVFQLASSWDTRETVLVALQIVAREEGEDFDREEMIDVLQEIKEACEAESGGGSYRINCLEAATGLLDQFGANG